MTNAIKNPYDGVYLNFSETLVPHLALVELIADDLTLHGHTQARVGTMARFS